MIQKRVMATIFSVILESFTLAVHSETIFRCGDTYSQTPCAGASQININDASDPARKKEVDAATRRDTKLAKSLEQQRLKQEKAANAPLQNDLNANITASKIIPNAATEAPPTLLTPKRPRKQTYKPKGFIALVPGSDVKNTKQKKAAKKQAAASR